ncbi:MAG: peptide chain release factor N(5)-glutamine methyltransferase [Vicingaceae bacterium]
MKLKEYIQELKSELAQIFQEREAENHLGILLQHFFGLSRVDRVLRAEEEVGASKLDELDKVLAELRKEKPIDYVLNESIFWGYPFYVDERVLIPRSETEELVMLVLEHEKEENISIFDIGTGSGCIPIALGMERAYAQIDACDVSKPALEVAQKNAEKHQVEVRFFEMDILTDLPEHPYDVVVSNPPYVKEEEIASLQKRVNEYEPIIALTPHGDPLKFYKHMINQTKYLLKKGGRFYWEIHEDLGPEVIELFANRNFDQIDLIEDMYGRNRMVKARWLG